MKLHCGDKIVDADDIIMTSKIFKDMKADCDVFQDYINVPVEFYNVVSYVLNPKNILINIHVCKFVADAFALHNYNSGIIFYNICAQCKIKINRYSEHFSADCEKRRIQSRKEIEQSILYLQFCNFMNIKSSYLNILATYIGQILEESEIIIDILPELLTLIVTNHPALYLYQRYENVWLQNDLALEIKRCPLKFESIYYHKRYNRQVAKEQYIAAKNKILTLYYTHVIAFEELNNDKDEPYIVHIYTGDMGVLNSFKSLYDDVKKICS